MWVECSTGFARCTSHGWGDYIGTCTPLVFISETAGRVVLEFDVGMIVDQLSMHFILVLRVGYIWRSSRAYLFSASRVPPTPYAGRIMPEYSVLFEPLTARFTQP